MKMAVVFSSATGNTRKVAYEMLKAMPDTTTIHDLKEGSQGIEADFFLLGYWVHRAKPNQEMAAFMEGLQGKKVAAFGTLGDYPDSPHAQETRQNVEALLAGQNTLLGQFLCQGRIDPQITAMFQKAGAQGPHQMTEERMKKHQEAAKHPNEADFQAARHFVTEILNKLEPV